MFYKQTLRALSMLLSIMYTQLMSVSAVPEMWKPAVVVPVFKGGITTNVSNCRPISLTCVASRVMEKVIVSQITDFFLG